MDDKDVSKDIGCILNRVSHVIEYHFHLIHQSDISLSLQFLSFQSRHTTVLAISFVDSSFDNRLI